MVADGERYELVPLEEEDEKAGQWVPYEGPEGGSGWRNVATDEVRYQKDPPGGLVSPDEVPDELYDALAEQHGVEPGRIREFFEETYERHGGGEGGVPEEPATAEDLGLNLSATKEKHEGVPVLELRQQKRLKNGLADRHGRDAVDDAYSFLNSWKVNSYSDRAQTLERAYMEANGIEGEPRNHELQGEEPDEKVVSVLRDIGSISREFVRENYGDEHRAHRGVGSRAHSGLMRGAFERLGRGEAPQSVDVKMSPVANFSMRRGVADSFGARRSVVSTWMEADDVVNATDLITQGRGAGEAEVSYRGNGRTVPMNDVHVWGDVPLSKMFERPLGFSEAEVFVDEADRLSPAGADDPMEILSSPREDAEWERRLEENPDRDPVEVAVEVARDIGGKEPLTDDAAAGVLELLDRAEEAAETAADRGGEDAEYRAIRMRDAIDEIRDKLGERAEGKQDEGGGPLVLDVSRYEEDLNWMNAGDAEDEKAWVPYEGPRGGAGWRNASTGEVRYQDEPPGETRPAVSASAPQGAAPAGGEPLAREEARVEADYDVEFASATSETAEKVADTLIGFNEAGLTDSVTSFRLDEKVSINGVELEGWHGAYNPKTGEMAVSARSLSPDADIEDVFSSDHPLAPLYHEVGHAAHQSNITEEEWDEISRRALKDARVEEDWVAEEVSVYAQENGFEYVAEVFAKLVAGEEVSDRAMGLYRELGGVEL